MSFVIWAQIFTLLLLCFSDSKELQSWVDTINTTAASLSAPALPMAVSSDNCKLGRDLYPVSHTKLSLVCRSMLLLLPLLSLLFLPLLLLLLLLF